jgi:Zn-dependent protease
VVAVSLKTTHLVFWAGLAALAFFQLMAVVLNLLPVPGLDGYGALEPHLSRETQHALEPAKMWGFVVLFALLMIGPLRNAFFALVGYLFELSGVTRGLAFAGLNLVQFWYAL